MYQNENFQLVHLGANSMIRPRFSRFPKNKYISFKLNNHYYNNSGQPNLENEGENISGFGSTFINSTSISVLSKFIYIKLSPTIYLKDDKIFQRNIKTGTFRYINDSNMFTEKAPKASLMQSTILFYYNSIGMGISNENYWIGPGFHTSLAMSSNAPGFNNIFIRSVKDISILKMKANFLYFFSKLNEEENSQPFYYTNLYSSVSVGKSPIINFGINRSFISGRVKNSSITPRQAATLVFDRIRRTNDPWDQMIVGYLNMMFPESKTNIYIELGTDDSRANLTDLKAHWDHASGIIVGFKKFGLFNTNSVFFGAEYMSTKNLYTLKFYRGNRSSPNFYEKGRYNFSSFYGRKWGAHSGSDSDDKIIMLGYVKEKFSLILSFNIERHGVISQDYPEIKYEGIIRLKKQIKKIVLNLYLENERIYNYNFRQNNNPEISNVFGIGIDYSMGIHN